MQEENKDIENKNLTIKQGNPFTASFKSTLGKGLGCLTLIIIVIILLGILGSPGKKQGAPQKASPDQEQTKAPKPTAASFKIGDRVETEDYFITVKGVRKSAGNIAPKNGYSYLLVDVLIENKTDKEKTISSMLSSSLRDSEGIKYSVSFGADNKGSLDGKLLPNDKVRGEVAFEIPTNASGLKYYFESGVFGGQTVVINLEN